MKSIDKEEYEKKLHSNTEYLSILEFILSLILFSYLINKFGWNLKEFH